MERESGARCALRLVVIRVGERTEDRLYNLTSPSCVWSIHTRAIAVLEGMMWSFSPREYGWTFSGALPKRGRMVCDRARDRAEKVHVHVDVDVVLARELCPLVGHAGQLISCRRSGERSKACVQRTTENTTLHLSLGWGLSSYLLFPTLNCLRLSMTVGERYTNRQRRNGKPPVFSAVMFHRVSGRSLSIILYEEVPKETSYRSIIAPARQAHHL